MKKILLLVLVAFSLNGCINYENMFALDSDYMARRSQETRNFDSKNDKDILSASAAVLQDLGYTLEESESKLGLITASKDREAGSTAGRIMSMMVSGKDAVYDVKQKIYVNLVTTKSSNHGVNVRVGFARIIWDNRGEARTEKVEDANIYKEFFDKLSQSIYLTANNI